ncbi:hypothetical protein X474_19670 [Dethiosulfatarculus sandiegensis]|uniref:Uncharacterized protein n=1 Tax=Dethiosulfatarculus sandiegensis TaxID=1429043 RepID=A0A0D2J950_9BACT|nr:hypothetical protein X474_19670 [Dethiosulfatarculus sandiegensis]
MERVIRGCNQAVINKYGSIKFSSCSPALNKFFNVNMEALEK